MDKEEVIFENRAMPELMLRGAIIPASINMEERTVRVQYTTGARVFRQSYFQDDYFEELSTEKGHIRLGRMQSGAAPCLNSHRNSNLSDVMGAVIEADETHCTIKFSERAEVEGYWKDIVAGIIRNVSVGYFVYRYLDVTPDGDKVRILRAIDWEPFEVSMVAVGADAGAGVRSMETKRCVVIGTQAEPTEKGLNTMTKEEIEAKARADAAELEKRELENKKVTAPVTEARSTAEIAQDAVNAERTRTTEISKLVRTQGLGTDLAEKLIADGKTIDQARAAVLDHLASDEESTRVRSHVKITKDEMETRTAAIETAIMHRSSPAENKLEGAAREFRGMDLLDLAKEILGHQNVRGMSKMEIAHRAMHSTSDFTAILANVANKSLRKGYADTKRSFVPFCREISLPDFKKISRVALSNAPSLKQVYEGGEYEYGTFTENAEEYRLFTYGRMFSISREAIINDDMDAFTRVPQKMAAAAARLENRMVWDIILGNPVMADGVTLFHASHGNLVNNLLNIAGLGAMRKAARVQKDPSGEDTLNTEMQYLLLPASLETTGLQLQGQYMPQQASNVNPYSNSFTIITEAYLDSVDAVSWYMAASPNDIDTIEYAYLDGQQGPYLETRDGFYRDGVEMKARHDFACKAIDWRGLVKSTGNGA